MESEAEISKKLYYPPGGILMWIIIFLELFTFGMALLAMIYYSKEEPLIFHNSKLLLNTELGTINTLLLITSGFFMAKSVTFFKEKNIKKTTFFLKLTLLTGLLFLIIKSIEYYLKIEGGYTMNYNTFFSFYWMLTLFHVVHVLVGMVILISTYFGITKNTTTLDDFEAGAAFWHMCDLIWLLLFPIIYLIF